MVKRQAKIDDVFAALSDPTRRRILLGLRSGAASPVTELARPFRISLPAISRHLRVLERARLIERRREGRVHAIRLRPKGLTEARDWMAQFAAAWDRSFDTLEQLLKEEEANEVRSKTRRRKT